MVETEYTHRIALPLLLPEIPDEHDGCVARLEQRMLAAQGVERAHTARAQGQLLLCIHYLPEQISLGQVQRVAECSGAVIRDRFRHETLRLFGLECTACAVSLERILGRLDGMLSASVSYAGERVRLEYDATRLSRRRVRARIARLGYRVREGPAHGWLRDQAGLLRSLLAGMFLGLGWGVERLLAQALAARPEALPPVPLLVPTGLYAASMLIAGLVPARSGLAAAWRRRFEVDLLMTLAAAGAAALGRWADGAFLLFLFSLGHALEQLALRRARDAITALGDLAPATALVRRGGAERELPVEELLRGDRVIVRPGDRIPADGLLRGGRSAVDNSTITGESLPVEVGPGDPVFAGSLNGAGALELEVTRLARESTLARIITLVREAQAQKSPSQQVAEGFTRVLVPLALAGSAAVILLPPLLGWLTWQQSLLRGLTILVASSPCALAIATPSAVLSAVARAARSGVLIKGGAHLENLGRTRAIAFDKTGTLTAGRPEITDVLPTQEAAVEDLLRAAASAEQHSTHPLGAAIVESAAQHGIHPPPAAQTTSLAGQGLRARVDGMRVEIGSPRFFASEIPPDLLRQVEALELQGKTAVLVRREGRFLGLLAAADRPRPEAASTLKALRSLGIEGLALLTGDNPAAAQALGRKLGLTDVRARLLPEDKVLELCRLGEQHGAVAMVGDGINDAPALAQATVGIAMGAGGSHLALETADVALMADDLSSLPLVVSLSRAARRVIRQNLALSAAVIAGLLPAAALGLTGIAPAVLLHEGATLLVVLNALRLLAHPRR